MLLFTHDKISNFEEPGEHKGIDETAQRITFQKKYCKIDLTHK